MARAVAVIMLAATTLAGCGTAQQPVPNRPDVARSADPALVPALTGEQPRAAADPRALARQLTVAETAARNRATPPELVAAAGRTAQVAYLALLDRPANYLAARGAADGTDADLDKALYRYNNDSRYVQAVRH